MSVRDEKLAQLDEQVEKKESKAFLDILENVSQINIEKIQDKDKKDKIKLLLNDLVLLGKEASKDYANFDIYYQENVDFSWGKQKDRCLDLTDQLSQKHIPLQLRILTNHEINIFKSSPAGKAFVNIFKHKNSQNKNKITFDNIIKYTDLIIDEKEIKKYNANIQSQWIDILNHFFLKAFLESKNIDPNIFIELLCKIPLPENQQKRAKELSKRASILVSLIDYINFTAGIDNKDLISSLFKIGAKSDTEIILENGQKTRVIDFFSQIAHSNPHEISKKEAILQLVYIPDINLKTEINLPNNQKITLLKFFSNIINDEFSSDDLKKTVISSLLKINQKKETDLFNLAQNLKDFSNEYHNMLWKKYFNQKLNNFSHEELHNKDFQAKTSQAQQWIKNVLQVNGNNISVKNLEHICTIADNGTFRMSMGMEKSRKLKLQITDLVIHLIIIEGNDLDEKNYRQKLSLSSWQEEIIRNELNFKLNLTRVLENKNIYKNGHQYAQDLVRCACRKFNIKINLSPQLLADEIIKSNDLEKIARVFYNEKIFKNRNYTYIGQSLYLYYLNKSSSNLAFSLAKKALQKAKEKLKPNSNRKEYVTAYLTDIQLSLLNNPPQIQQAKESLEKISNKITRQEYEKYNQIITEIKTFSSSNIATLLQKDLSRINFEKKRKEDIFKKIAQFNRQRKIFHSVLAKKIPGNYFQPRAVEYRNEGNSLYLCQKFGHPFMVAKIELNLNKDQLNMNEIIRPNSRQEEISFSICNKNYINKDNSNFIHYFSDHAGCSSRKRGYYRNIDSYLNNLKSLNQKLTPQFEEKLYQILISMNQKGLVNNARINQAKIDPKTNQLNLLFEKGNDFFNYSIDLKINDKGQYDFTDLKSKLDHILKLNQKYQDLLELLNSKIGHDFVKGYASFDNFLIVLNDKNNVEKYNIEIKNDGKIYYKKNTDRSAKSCINIKDQDFKNFIENIIKEFKQEKSMLKVSQNYASYYQKLTNYDNFEDWQKDNANNKYNVNNNEYNEYYEYINLDPKFLAYLKEYEKIQKIKPDFKSKILTDHSHLSSEEPLKTWLENNDLNNAGRYLIGLKLLHSVIYSRKLDQDKRSYYIKLAMSNLEYAIYEHNDNEKKDIISQPFLQAQALQKKFFNS